MLEDELKQFAATSKVRTKGSLSVCLALTRMAAGMKPPFKEEDFITPRRGQVARLSKSAVQSILSEHGISRVLAKEAGRTSRGSIDRMRKYLDLLNELGRKGMLDFDRIEQWWIGQIRQYFTSQPLKVRMETSRSMRQIISSLLLVAFERQKELGGMMVAGAVMEHLVGAKLSLAVPDAAIEQKGFSVADDPKKGKGDFLVGDTVIHVTTAPTEGLIAKCAENIAEGLRSLIITTKAGVSGGEALAEAAGIEGGIDILDIEQFVTTNVYEWTGFEQDKRKPTLRRLLEAYNRIIDECETDPSLKIALD